MRLATVAQCAEIDELSQKVYGLSGEILMESAGAVAARELDQAFYPDLKRGMTAIVSGPGNNGADGFVTARHLHSAGHRDLRVFCATLNPEKTSSLFQIQLKRAQLQGIKIISLDETPEKLEQLLSSSLIVDALFGIGLSRTVEGLFLSIIDKINSVKVPVVSLDAPSGLHCDTGVVEGATVRATMTLSFGLAKPGFFVADGPTYTGKVRILPIGFPFESLRGVATTHFLFNEKLAKRYLPSRSETGNKSDQGRMLLLAGHSGTWGAAVLSAVSAYRMGCGYVTLASEGVPYEKLAEAPEVLTASSRELFDKEVSQFQSIAIGPGFGVNEHTAEWIKKLKKEKVKNVVIDADAITVCVQHGLFPLPETWVITPHSGELARILKISSQEIQKDRFAAAQLAANICGCHVVLKGYKTILSYKERCMVVNSGNSALAKAGTGDVLTGMIGSMLAQGLETLQGTAAAVYVHGRLADEWVRLGNDRNTLLASDLKDFLPQLLGRLSGGTLI
ncbi:MAG: NAD(P)H-hydrate dehydratase [Bdellovibrionales bacterium]|nr:NAD(P)H-hydrate dehydratase [Bdellovibrionales bacterium]